MNLDENKAAERSLEMTHKEINELLFEHTLRFENVIYLAGALAAGDTLPDALGDFLDGEDDRTLLEVFPDFPLAMRDKYTRRELPEVAAAWLIGHGMLGFAAQVATPVMRPNKIGNGSSYSWGYCSSRWLYGETMDEVVQKAIAWANEQRESEKAEAPKGQLND